MSDDYVRTIDDLIARYQFEKGLNDIFVEGPFDREVLAVSAASPNARVAYEISTVDVPYDLLLRHGLTDGNKQRVIALMRELAVALPQCPCIGLVDRDLDHWFGDLETTGGLRWTTYCSMEMHFLNDQCIENILQVTSGIQMSRHPELIPSMKCVLLDLYALRLSARALALPVRWPELKRYLTRRGDQIVFDSANYTRNALISSGCGAYQDSVRTTSQSYVDRFTAEIRLNCHGHDFVTLLAWTIKKFNGIADYASEKAVERLFLLLARLSPTVQAEIWSPL